METVVWSLMQFNSGMECCYDSSVSEDRQTNAK